MRLRGLLALAIVTATVAITAPSAAASDLPIEIVSVEIAGDDATRFVVDGRRYAGPLRFTALRDGLTLTEQATIEQYLQGIALALRGNLVQGAIQDLLRHGLFAVHHHHIDEFGKQLTPVLGIGQDVPPGYNASSGHNLNSSG